LHQIFLLLALIRGGQIRGEQIRSEILASSAIIDRKPDKRPVCNIAASTDYAVIFSANANKLTLLWRETGRQR
jgi:hypothetical protein